jgi:large subunit ribosomal protein L29
MADIDDIRALSDSDLYENLDTIERDMMDMRFKIATMQLTNVNEIKNVKKRVARIKTVIRERQIAESYS